MSHWSLAYIMYFDHIDPFHYSFLSSLSLLYNLNRFHYSISIHTYEVLWSPFASPFTLPLVSTSKGPPCFTLKPFFLGLSRFYMWQSTCDICLSESGLFQST
jgi:hypothetical protein